MKIGATKYTENFCEENIWHLCQHQDLTSFTKKVLIVSNSSRNCPFLFQKSSVGGAPVWWDYHVILLVSGQESDLIYDFDSSLEFPSTLNDYLGQTFPAGLATTSNDLPYFKVIDSAVYTDTFSSDRSHMKYQEGNWIFTPPKWPLISNLEKLFLPQLLDFSKGSNQTIYDLETLLYTKRWN